jgi:broad specificity phosphatase PhoE
LQEAYLIRHGTVDCAPGVEYGRLPGFGLSAKGNTEAGQAARFLAGRSVEVIYCSPLERCVQTAAVIASTLHIPTIESPEVNEWDKSESLRDVLARMNAFWKMVSTESREKIGVVSHRDPLRALMLGLSGDKLSDIYRPEILPFEPGAVWLLKPGPNGTAFEKVFRPEA